MYGGNLGAGRAAPHLLSVSCIRDSLLGLTLDLTNCVGFHTATKERKTVSRDSTRLIPHRSLWHIFPGVLGPAGVVAEPPCNWAGRGRAGFYPPFFLAMWKGTPEPGQQTRAQLVESCCHLLDSRSASSTLFLIASFAKDCHSLMPQIPNTGATCLPLKPPRPSTGASDSCLCLWLLTTTPANKAVPSALYSNTSVQTRFLAKANKPCNMVTRCQLSSCYAVCMCRAQIPPRQTPFPEKLSQALAPQG